jgi:hypothetical protein
LSGESLESISVQQTRPKHRAGHVGHVSPVHSRSQGGANDAANAGSNNYYRPDARLLKRLDNADVSKSAHSAAA